MYLARIEMLLLPPYLLRDFVGFRVSHATSFELQELYASTWQSPRSWEAFPKEKLTIDPGKLNQPCPLVSRNDGHASAHATVGPETCIV